MAENRSGSRNNRGGKRYDDRSGKGAGDAVTFRDGQPVYKRDSQSKNGGESKGGYQKSGYQKSGYQKSGFGESKGGYQKSGFGESKSNPNYGDRRSEGKPQYGEKPRGNRGYGDGHTYNDRDRDSSFDGGRYSGVRNSEGKRGGDYRTADKSEYRGGNREFNRNDNRNGNRYDNRSDERGKPRHGFDKRDAERNAAVPQTEVPPEAAQTEAELPNIIMGRNPVKEAIKSGRSIDRILVVKEHDGSLNEILDMARDSNLVVRDVERAKLDEICQPFGHSGKTGNHQGIVAYIPEVEYCEIADILALANERGEDPFVVLLDGVEDPHNLGSIIRSAECAGAHGVVITKRRSASVTAAVMKSSAGATEHMLIAKVVNLSIAMEQLKAAGVWVTGADMNGDSLYTANLKGPFALVVGAEGAGLSRLVKERCDYTVSIPLMGKMESLNASVAAAIIMFEKVRQGR